MLKSAAAMAVTLGDNRRSAAPAPPPPPPAAGTARTAGAAAPSARRCSRCRRWSMVRLAEDQDRARRIGNDADGRVVRRGRGTGRPRERIGARDRDHLVQDGRQRHAVHVAQRGVVGAVEAEGDPERAPVPPCRRRSAAAPPPPPPPPPRHRPRLHHRRHRRRRSPPLAEPGTQRSTELTGRRDRRDPQLAEPVHRVLQGDHDLRDSS